jgi:MFS transporter, FHS family, L-fucose permease
MNWFYKNTGYRPGQRQLVVPFILVTLLFFFWAFVHNINGTLIPHLRKALQLTDTQSSFIDVAIYIAYFLAAIPAGLVIRRQGYRFTILAGLTLFAAGAFLFVPAAYLRSYPIFLAALFVFGFGAAFLETVANPYIAGLGDPRCSTTRLNLAQSFNGIGAVVTPLVGSVLILSGVTYSESALAALPEADRTGYLRGEALGVVPPYLVLGCVIVAVIVLFLRSRIPEPPPAADAAAGAGASQRIFRHPRLVFAVVAQFFYVGAQVGVASFFVRFAQQAASLTDRRAGFLWGSCAMVGFMVGRFAGTWMMRAIAPARLLVLFAVANVLLLAAAINTTGMLSVGLLMAVPFFMSIMFPTIFDLGIQRTGEMAKLGSSLLIMAIVGGAFAPVVMGWISDATHNMQLAYYVPLACFAVVALFGWKGSTLDAAVEK